LWTTATFKKRLGGVHYTRSSLAAGSVVVQHETDTNRPLCLGVLTLSLLSDLAGCGGDNAAVVSPQRSSAVSTNSLHNTHLESSQAAYYYRTLRDTAIPIRLSVPWRSCLGYRRAGCLQLSHRRPPKMCGLRTRPRTKVDPPRFLSSSLTYTVSGRALNSTQTKNQMSSSNCRRRGHIVSPPPG